MSDLRIGTCSWKYDSWRGIVYPERGEFDYLEEYAKRYDTVEVDQWFWSLFPGGKVALPKEIDAARYARAVPEGFLFTVKAPNSITLTHARSPERGGLGESNAHFLSPGLYREFLGRLEPLRAKIGMVMLQFEYLNRKKMGSQGAFLERLADFLEKRPPGPELGVECRNPGYLDETWFRFLRERGVHHVFCQGYYMPPAWEVGEKHEDLLTDSVVVRLMGTDRKEVEIRGGERWNSILEPRDAELARIVSLVKGWRKRGKRVYVNVNNHYEGSAPLTAGKVRRLISGPE